MRIKDFYALVELEREPDASILSDLKRLVNRYPLFQAGIFIYIKCLYLTDAANYVSELNRLTPFVHDRRALFYYVLNEVYDRFKSKPKSQEIEDRTNMLIDAFFETSNDTVADSFIANPLSYASQSPHNMISSDYLSYVGLSDINASSCEADGDTISDTVNVVSSNVPKMRGQEIIDRFIEKSEELETPILPIGFNDNINSSDDDMPIEEESEDDFFFTQALVDIYIKQQKYDRAYEIIKRLSLNYPEKNIYFADQLKYLEKYIKNIE